MSFFSTGSRPVGRRVPLDVIDTLTGERSIMKLKLVVSTPSTRKEWTGIQ